MTAIGRFVRQHRVAGIDSRDRRNLASIRLASRSELFCCSVVGLLFLPAAGHRTADGYGGGNSFVRYWSVAAAPTSMDSAYKLDIQSNFMRTGNTQARFTGFSVRLASREVCLL